MDFNKLYDSLDESLNKKKPKIDKCCDIISNFQSRDGIIICTKCNKIINNIIDSPEWRFYGASDSKNSDPTRCGMPINMLLPDSSVGTSINNKGRNSKVALYQQWNSMPYKEKVNIKYLMKFLLVVKKIIFQELLLILLVLYIQLYQIQKYQEVIIGKVL